MENKYYDLIISIIKAHKKYSGLESIIDDIANDVLDKSKVVFETISNEEVLMSYLSKVVNTSIITVSKKMGITNKSRETILPQESDLVAESISTTDCFAEENLIETNDEQETIEDLENNQGSDESEDTFVSEEIEQNALSPIDDVILEEETTVIEAEQLSEEEEEDNDDDNEAFFEISTEREDVIIDLDSSVYHEEDLQEEDLTKDFDDLTNLQVDKSLVDKMINGVNNEIPEMENENSNIEASDEIYNSLDNELSLEDLVIENTTKEDYTEAQPEDEIFNLINEDENSAENEFINDEIIDIETNNDVTAENDFVNKESDYTEADSELLISYEDNLEELDLITNDTEESSDNDVVQITDYIEEFDNTSNGDAVIAESFNEDLEILDNQENIEHLEIIEEIESTEEQASISFDEDTNAVLEEDISLNDYKTEIHPVVTIDEELDLSNSDDLLDTELVENESLASENQNENIEFLLEENYPNFEIEELLEDTSEDRITSLKSDEENQFDIEEEDDDDGNNQEQEFVPPTYDWFGEITSKQYYDTDSVFEEIVKLDKLNPDKNVLKICDLKYNQNLSISEISTETGFSEDFVIEVLRTVIEAIKD